MSTKNTIENTSLVSEHLYSNPKNLIYYLFKPQFADIKAIIIKKYIVLSSFGAIEIAIIGASHYFKLENYFTELLSCLPEKASSKELFMQTNSFEAMINSSKLNDLNYKFSTKQTEYLSAVQFNEAELQISAQKNTLIHAFKGQSAITALQLAHNNTEIILKTWHTYPDFLRIVYSETKVNKV